MADLDGARRGPHRPRGGDLRERSGGRYRRGSGLEQELAGGQPRQRLRVRRRVRGHRPVLRLAQGSSPARGLRLSPDRSRARRRSLPGRRRRLLRRHRRLPVARPFTRQRQAAAEPGRRLEHGRPDRRRSVRVRGGADRRGVLLPRVHLRRTAAVAHPDRRVGHRAVGRGRDHRDPVRPRPHGLGGGSVPDPARLPGVRAVPDALADRLAVSVHRPARGQQLPGPRGQPAALGRRRDPRAGGGLGDSGRRADAAAGWADAGAGT